MVTKARSYSLPLTRPTRIVPFGSDHPTPSESLVNSSLAYELFLSVKITPCVLTGSIVPNGGNTADGIFAVDAVLLSSRGRGWARFNVKAVDLGRESSTKRVWVGFARDCIPSFEATSLTVFT